MNLQSRDGFSTAINGNLWTHSFYINVVAQTNPVICENQMISQT